MFRSDHHPQLTPRASRHCLAEQGFALQPQPGASLGLQAAPHGQQGAWPSEGCVFMELLPGSLLEPELVGSVHFRLPPTRRAQSPVSCLPLPHRVICLLKCLLTGKRALGTGQQVFDDRKQSTAFCPRPGPRAVRACPPGLPPGVCPGGAAHSLRWGFRFSCVLYAARSCSVVLSATPRTVTRQAPLSMGFCRQESWSG